MSLSHHRPTTPVTTRLIVGTPIVVVPSTSNELDDTDQAELNNQEELPPEPTSTQGDSLNEYETSKQAIGVIERITKEWEQLIINEIPKISSPTCVSKPKLDHLAFTPIESSKPLDKKTSRILERLEIPQKLKSKIPSPVIRSSSAPIDSCMLTKRHLILFQPTQTSDTGPAASQPMRPNFQRMKRKNR
ncbi:hypothetical protein Tco_0341008 [Tanacetum coccineum]